MRTRPIAGAFVAGLASLLTFAPPHGSAGAATPAHRASEHFHRRPSDQCTGTGDTGFVGGGADNAAAGQNSGVLEGAENKACASDAVIGGGSSNLANGVAASIGGGAFNTAGQEAFVGAGSNNAASLESFVGSGVLNSASATGSFIGGGDTLYGSPSAQTQPGNIASGVDSFVGAGDLNQVSGQGSFIGAGGSAYAQTGAGAAANTVSGVDSFLGAGDQNTVNGSWSFVGGGEVNGVNGSGSFIGSGGYLNTNGLGNFIAGNDSFIGAGDSNTIVPDAAFIGGGMSNQIANAKSGAGARYAAIVGGLGNTISAAVANGAEYGSIAGGIHNSLSGIAATIGGGYDNFARGSFSTVPGGERNQAAGIGSFAAGTGAQALQDGTFVWSDGSGSATVKSSKPYQFVARASGGYALYSNAAETAGAQLTAGSGTWASLSDRSMKTRVVALDDAAILAKVTSLPVSEWSYVSERGVRHVGPMAQDFYSAFHVGADDRHITSIDEDGVALAAIKALHCENQSLRARLAALERKVDALTRR